MVVRDGVDSYRRISIRAICDVKSAQRADICEIELELRSGRVERLFDFARELAVDLPLSLEPASKAARGVRLVSSASGAPVRAENAALSRDATAGDVLASIIRVCLRQIEGNADGLAREDDAEWIHQMRIGTRRLRAC